MKKQLIATLCLSFVSVLILGTSIVAAGDDEKIIIPYYDYISATTVSLSIENNGLAYSSGSLKIYEDYDTSITLILQRKESGSNTWTDVKSWTQSFSGIGSHVFEKKYYVSSGYTYRVINTTKVLRNGSVIETIHSYSHEERY
ncbi:hypothetical protein [Paenibacillus jiagnxiensis]|uniref:hypothetical protein n=1 Tax=Paenibacillus jiagnxiensis TaxID=3228926 RepID=UPI0033A8FD54